MSTSDLILWGVLPYLTIGVLVGGTVWRWRYDRFGWTTRSSELYESRLLRIGSPVFHFGLLFVIFGHVLGLVIPESWTAQVGVGEGAYHVTALALGGVDGVPTDKTMYVVLVAAIVAGLEVTVVFNGIRSGVSGYDYRGTVAPWFRSIFLLAPDVRLMAAAPVDYQVHTLVGMALFAVWPFTRLIHAFTVPVHYLFRPYIVYRRRAAARAPGARQPRRGWEGFPE
jgi:nitrate reductase gamma subunit